MPGLDRAGRVQDFLQLGDLMCLDALHRKESCGAHFRREHQTSKGDPLRNDEEFANVSAWAWNGPDQTPTLHRENLTFELLGPALRKYD